MMADNQPKRSLFPITRRQQPKNIILTGYKLQYLNLFFFKAYFTSWSSKTWLKSFLLILYESVCSEQFKRDTNPNQALSSYKQI